MRTVDPGRHRARRRQIVDAAAGLFAAKGFERTTTAEICKAAGTSTGNLFHYFPNKRAIFHAVLEEDEADGAGKAQRLAAARTADDPWTALLETVDLLAAPATRPSVPALVMEAMVQAYRDPDLAALLSRANDEERSTLTTVLRNAVVAGQIDPGLDPEATAAWVQALIGALYTTAATDPSFDPAAQLPTLRLILQRFLRPAATSGPRRGKGDRSPDDSPGD
ncbi:TetR/AcrR family transcriptional regulator [Streptantibioticus cattleyicolor]|uniref:TetR family transcriptional regulator n=1 Tax=Streptantibioticus cattleyicolor (strain ATCC 35852 / DSM 46488 / JCM 4925 / NBRC 14057 / NRRL 8057) TaxID=1003195 RepID=F8JL27_STREN|nr:TetR/AcrR family transcriptional regulator [Streptantibioticus cattleyicolor]AEW98395.1 TetR family transcriptional regulator [Streptantibioticus cattleyicolor NRRL 8057 = DSM 46488]CCB72547.1 putative TetR-family transcriptional regulator [Streptantibioticus cattleyicolor NRRL 8057 = DSM 46488]